MKTRLFALLSLPLFLAHCSESAEDSTNAGGGTGATSGAATGGAAGSSAGASGLGGTTAGASTGGASGSSGASGASGASGSAGASGASGASGAAGADGGSSGASGASGAGGAASGTGGAASGSGGAGGAGGASGNAGAGGQSGTGGGGAFMLTSSAIMEGGMFPDAHTCAGANTCPPLTWTAGPSGTLSYAVSLVDMSNMLEHWVIWDIPPTVTMIENVPSGAMPAMPAGAKQRAFGNTSATAYSGPCPRGDLHTYVFTVYALDVATVPNAMTSMMPEQIIAAIVATTPLASDTLSSQSDASM